MGVLDRVRPGRKRSRATGPQVLLASGVRITRQNADAVRRSISGRQEWQQHAWAYRDLIGELREGLQYQCRAVGRVSFVPAQINPDADEPWLLDADECTLPPALREAAVEELNRLPIDSMMWKSRLAENLAVPGEVWLHGHPDPRDPDGEVWDIRSVDEIEVGMQGEFSINNGGNRPDPVDLDTDDLLRLWLPHPARYWQADSPLRALLDVCEDVVLIGKELRAASRSRIAANGILLFPDGMMLGTATRTENVSASSAGFVADLTAQFSAPIANEGEPGAVVPVILTGDAEDIKEVRHVEIAREDSPALISKLDKALGRLGAGMDIPAEIITGMSEANHWCVDEQTEVFTSSGWRTHEQVEVGDLVLGVDPATGQSRWQPVLDMYRADVTGERMIEMRTRNHHSVTTSGHRWLVTQVRKGDERQIVRHSDELTGEHRIPTAAPADLPITPKWSDEFVALAGWYWTEGNSRGSNRGVTVAQSHTRNPTRVAAIRAALATLYGPAVASLRGTTAPAWREHAQANTSSHGGPVTVFSLNRAASEPLHEVAPHKRLRVEFVGDLTAAQLALFVDVSAQGDGQHYRSGRLDMWQADPAALDAYEAALILSGRTVMRSDGGRRVSPWAQDDVRPVKAARPVEVEYTGTVWCPVTDTGTWLARRSGTVYYTGNSAWAIDTATFRHHIEPLVRVCDDALAEGYLREALLARRTEGGEPEFDPADVAQVCVWHDAGNLTENPNRGQDAINAYDRGAIGFAALRDALGFAEGDEPDDDEFVRMIAWKAGIAPELAATLLRAQIGARMFPELPVVDAQPAIGPGQRADDPADDERPRKGGDGIDPDDPVPDDPPDEVQAAVVERGVRLVQTLLAAGYAGREFEVREDVHRSLFDLERATRQRLAAECDSAVRRAVERAHARTVSRTNGRDDLRAAIGDQRDRAATVLGREAVFALGLDEQRLLADAWAALYPRFARIVGRAVVEAARLTARLLGLSGDAAEAVEARVVDDMTARIDPAWNTLQDRLDERAIAELFDPLDPAGDTGGGEGRDLVITEQDMRDALSEIGGELAEIQGVDGGTEAPGGLTSGSAVTQELLDHGGTRLGFEFHYGITVHNPFEPHQALHMQRFPSWTDDALSTALTWGGAYAWVGPYFRPGDHQNCSCDAMPLWAIPEHADAEVGPDRPQMRHDRLLAEDDDRQGDNPYGRGRTTAQQDRDERDRVRELQRKYITEYERT